MRLEQQILDALDKAHDFPLPETLVTNEFDGIWKQLDPEPGAGGQDALPTRARRGRARGRVPQNSRAARAPRPLIGEIGEKSGLQVSQEELQRALIDRRGAIRARRSSSTSSTRRTRRR